MSLPPITTVNSNNQLQLLLFFHQELQYTVKITPAISHHSISTLWQAFDPLTEIGTALIETDKYFFFIKLIREKRFFLDKYTYSGKGTSHVEHLFIAKPLLG